MISRAADSPHEDIPRHVTRYLAGEASPAERAEAERWREASPERRMRFAEMDRLWWTAATLPSPARIDRMWQALSRTMRMPDDRHDAAGP